MRLFSRGLLACACLVVPLIACAEAGEEKDHAEKDDVAAQAPGLKAPVLKPKPPLGALPEFQPKQIDTRPALIQRPAHTEMKAKPPAVVPPEPRVQRREQPRPPFWNPRQQPGDLGPAAVVQLESMGNHVQLSPALRFYLNRPGTNPRPVARLLPPATTTAPRQVAQPFYPGVSRLPAQKPFENLVPQPTAFQRYWPLLLEGRENPRTGLIIWTLP